MPVKKYNTQEEKEYAYRVNSKKYYWSKKGVDYKKKEKVKLAKSFVKDFLKSDESYLKVHELLSTTTAVSAEPSASESG